MNKVYEGINPNDVYKKYAPFSFKVGLETEAFLKVVAWLFIEQDIRYWYGDGRTRTKGGFDNFSPDKRASNKKALEKYKNIIEEGLIN